MEALIPVEVVEQRILLIRGQKVILDADLAKLYGVPTRVLNQAVRRNLKRFPQDFMFKGTSNNFQFVTPAQAGVQLCQELMDSCFRRNDIFRGSLNAASFLTFSAK
jgi:hypothetical protein